MFRVTLLYLFVCIGASVLGSSILCKGTVTPTSKSNEYTVLKNGVLDYSCPPNMSVKEWKSEIYDDMTQHVQDLQENLKPFLSAVMKDSQHTEGSLPWEVVCHVDGNASAAYMKFSYKNSFITFHLKNETWTQSDVQAAKIKERLESDYADFADKGKSILQEACRFCHELRKGGALGGGSDGASGRAQFGIIFALFIFFLAVLLVFVFCCMRKCKKVKYNVRQKR